jgi:xanthine dehydrogenase molybdopterin-binding subunit B
MGGAYGGKISPPAAMAAAAALGAMNLNRPVRLVLDFRTNMELVGKRYPYLIKYNVSYKLLSVDAKF